MSQQQPSLSGHKRSHEEASAASAVSTEEQPSSAYNAQEQDEQQPAKKLKIDEVAVKTVKILVCGDVEGKFQQLFKTVETIDRARGPFHMLLCVGKFFSTNEAPSEDVDETKEQRVSLQGAATEEDLAFLTSHARVPIPTFFIDAGGGNDFVESNQEGGEIAKNLTFLGRYGTMDLAGLKIAYLSGIMDKMLYNRTGIPTVANYREADIASFESQLDAAAVAGKVDILLTAEWPYQILRGLSKEQLPVPPKYINFREVGSMAVASLAKKCVPRYHFAAMEGAYFERAPYKTEVANRIAITRFIAVAPLSQSKEKNQKYLYAAGLTPVAQMPEDQLTKIVPGTTDSPFEEKKQQQQRQKDGKSQQQQQQSQGRGQQQQQGQRGHAGQKESVSVRQDCWFCLSSPKVEKHLLVNICENSYLALPKGGLNEDHLLIIPVKHSENTLQLSADTLQEMMRYKNALKEMFAKESKNVIIFERYIHLDRVPVHMHFQVVCFPSSVTRDAIQHTFEQEATARGASFQYFSSDVELTKAIRDAGADKGNYHAVELPDGSKLIGKITDNKSMFNFAREVCAKLLGTPERSDWRQCALSTDEEKRLTQQMQRKFAPFAFDE